jgi:hypothetical protein
VLAPIVACGLILLEWGDMGGDQLCLRHIPVKSPNFRKLLKINTVILLMKSHSANLYSDKQSPQTKKRLLRQTHEE